jgi:hypothetical protein
VRSDSSDDDGGTDVVAVRTNEPPVIVRRELKRVGRLLGPEEVLVEIEEAEHREYSGALFVTTQRVLFVSTAIDGKRQFVVSLSLSEIADADLAGRQWIGPGEAIAFHLSAGPEQSAELRIAIRSGESERAREIVASTLRQRNIEASSSGHRPRTRSPRARPYRAPTSHSGFWSTRGRSVTSRSTVAGSTCGATTRMAA